MFALLIPSALLAFEGFNADTLRAAGEGGPGGPAQTGVGGQGGAGGNVVSPTGSPGRDGRQGGQGGSGGTGGAATWTVVGATVENAGTLYLTGDFGSDGPTGPPGLAAGGKGGKGGDPFRLGLPGDEPDPDRYPATQQGGDGGVEFDPEGRPGSLGGGGGGGAGYAIIYPFGLGGRGGDGEGGSGSDGSTGTTPALVAVSTTGGFRNEGTVWLGGDGGDGGPGGRGGSGGGGGGGVGGTVTEGFAGGDGGGAGAGGEGGDGGDPGSGALSIGVGARFVNESTGSIIVDTNPVAFASITIDGGELVNQGDISSAFGRIQVVQGTLVNSGVVSTGRFGATSVEAEGLLINDGRFGHLSNFGTVEGSGYHQVLINSGRLLPGGVPGEIQVGEQLTMLSGGEISIDVLGVLPGDFDVIRVAGRASLLGGTIRFEIAEEADLSPGVSLEFLECDWVTLDDVSVLGIQGTQAVEVELEVTATGLVAHLVPDSDRDGVYDDEDNCRFVANAGQSDFDAGQDDDSSLPGVQHYGDACDADLDNDGFVGPTDFFAVFRPCLGADLASRPECAVADLDGDGVVGPSDFFSRLRPAFGLAPGPGTTE
ncbi:MAG: thrombospondin type 3 repeat-containing protein [Myxococcota bacterium]|nr:thrombospondin type 3 repeat-containing protein [Myxococcota bacterium]